MMFVELARLIVGLAFAPGCHDTLRLARLPSTAAAAEAAAAADSKIDDFEPLCYPSFSCFWD